jgi:hypothetical protein
MQMANSERRAGNNATARAEPGLDWLIAIDHSPALFALCYSPFADKSHG